MSMLRLLLSSVVLLASSAFCAASPPQDVSYDYIIVGSGPGGGTLAANLARANFTVLLLEAGDDSLPGGVGDYSPGLAWDFFAKHYDDPVRNMMNHKITWRLKNGRYWVGAGSDTPPDGAELLGIYYPRGSALGGSSMINAMATFLPPASDWDYIANITGDASWSADKMNTIFQRIEHNNYLSPSTPGHGFSGFFQSTMPAVTSLAQPVLAVTQSIARAFGQNDSLSSILAALNTDPNNPLSPAPRDAQVGLFGAPFHTFPNGDRFSARNVVQDALKQDGVPLTLRMNALVTRVLWDRDQHGNETAAGKCATTSGSKLPRAVGVEYLAGTALYRADRRSYNSSSSSSSSPAPQRVFARREVILSGGAFNTPQLLKLSGVGPPSELAMHSIPVVVPLPGVGESMCDNEEMPIVGHLPRASLSLLPNSSDMAPGCVLLRTAHTPRPGERDVFLMHGPRALRGFYPPDQDNPAIAAAADPPGTYGVSIVKQFPQSCRGRVLLTSADPRDRVDVHVNHYAQGNATDLGAMLDVVAWARRVYGTVAAPLGPLDTVEPPCAAADVDAAGYCSGSAADLNWIVGQTFGHHPTSTARIGADGDDMAVLDSKFRVRGTAGLRVVDASAFPRSPGVFPVLPTFMISQKAADIIIEEAKTSGGVDIC